MLRTLSGLFLVGAVNRLRKRKRTRKRTNREDPRTIPGQIPEGPRIGKNQSREAILKKSSLQHGLKFSIENEIFIPGPSLAAEKQDLGLKFPIENEIFKPRMKTTSENENFVCGGVAF